MYEIALRKKKEGVTIKRISKNVDRFHSFYKYKDKNNCERVYNAILNSERKYNREFRKYCKKHNRIERKRP